MTLPSHESDKSLPDQFASIFLNKIKTIRETFIPSGTEYDADPPDDPPKITTFTQDSEDTVDKIINNSPRKSCLLDPWPTFFIKECSDILLPSITQLVNCSLMEGYDPDGFKTAVVTLLIKKATLPVDDFGVGGSVLKWFISNLSERYQSIKIGSTLFDLCKLLFAVPQGSVLGSLLFSLYTSSLSLVIGKYKGIKYHFMQMIPKFMSIYPRRIHLLPLNSPR